MLKRQYETIQKMYTEKRMMLHDSVHQDVLILEYLENGKYREAQTYFEKKIAATKKKSKNRYTGIEVCQMVREFSNVPIIMLTAKGEDMDKIMGLEYGADDYITKPFNILEVKARIKAILRRSGKKAEPVKPVNIMEINGMKVELDSRRVFVHGKELNLTAKEFDLLELLMAHPNKVYSRNELLDTIWGSTYPGDARTVDVHVRRLREKIEDNPGEPVYIHTKWGVGYYFKG